MWTTLKQKIQSGRRVCIIASSVAGLTIALRLGGLLQGWELSALDWAFRLRPPEPPDSRLVIVGIDETDLNQLGTWPIPDVMLAQLLNKIKQQQPRAIGLDIYRDLPVEPGYEELVKVFKSTPNLIGIRKLVGDDNQGEIAASPVLESLGQVAANDFPWDVDTKIRRVFLYLNDEEGSVSFSLGFMLAMKYLEGEGITPEMKDEIRIQLGEAVFSPFKGNNGGYVRAADEGYQILLNYRGKERSFETVSLTDVLEDRIPPDLMRDRIVAIGSTATSLKDFLLTPYSNTLFDIPKPMAGVEIHANVASSIIGAALNERSLIKTWPEWVEWVWIFMWAAIGASFTCQWRDIKGLPHISLSRITARISIASILLVAIAYTAFLLTWWIPIAPPLLALMGSAIATIGYTLLEHLKLSYQQLEDYAHTLEIKVEERTLELKENNHQLERALEELKATQKQLVVQEKLAYLGSLSAGIAHEIRNPLNFVNNFAKISVELTDELIEKLDNAEEDLEDLDIEYINQTLVDLKDSVEDIKQQGQRIEKIVEGMLLLSQSERGQRSLANLNAILAEAVELAYHSQREKDSSFQITLQTDYDEAIGKMEMVTQDMSRAFVNLFKNSCYALYEKKQAISDDYSPTLTIKTRDKSDRREENRGGAAVEIWIQDNGQGIAEENLDKIFNPFFTTKPTGEGTGLGLSLTYETIVGQHGGQIEIESTWGDRTEVTIVLPKTTSSREQY